MHTYKIRESRAYFVDTRPTQVAPRWTSSVLASSASPDLSSIIIHVRLRCQWGKFATLVTYSAQLAGLQRLQYGAVVICAGNLYVFIIVCVRGNKMLRML